VSGPRRSSRGSNPSQGGGDGADSPADFSPPKGAGSAPTDSNPPKGGWSVYAVLELPADATYDDVLALLGDRLGDRVQFASAKQIVYGQPGDYEAPPGWYSDDPAEAELAP